MSKNSYADINVYKGLEGIRRERAMYIGSTGLLNERHAPRGLTQISQEVMSNSVDEFVEGYGNEIDITIEKDNSMIIKDNGRGLPKGPDDTFDDVIKSATIPHASGKFIEGNGYNANGIAGMHGIGLKATNAVSKHMILDVTSHSTTKKDDETVLDGGLVSYRIEFKQEEVISQEIVARYKKNEIEEIKDNPSAFKLKSTGEIIKTGTSVHFYPDDGPVAEDEQQPVFESINWINDDLYSRFESSAFLNAGLKVTFTDERKTETHFNEETGEESESHLQRVWYFKDGIEEYVRKISQGMTLLKKVKDPIPIDSTTEEAGYKFNVQASLLFTDSVDVDIRSFANGVPTKEGGPHLDGFTSGLTRAINEYGKDKKLLKTSLQQSDVLQGVVAVFEIRIPSAIAKFEGQTKEKLGTSQAKNATYNIIYHQMLDWFYDNTDASEEIIKLMLDSKAARDMAVKARQAQKKARQSKGGKSLIVSSKLKSASSKNYAEKELYITEGDSASNIGRDPKTQAVFPIRGKILNTFDAGLARALSNKEISTITSVLGAGIGSEFKLEDMQYGKVIFATDADTDGAHIRTLLTGLFYKYFKPALKDGRVYIVKPPLYKAIKYVNGKQDIKMFYTEDERTAASKEIEGYDIQRYKGLGEMSLDEAHEALADPKTRKLTRITLDDVERANESLKILLGPDASLRANWIEDTIDFNEAYDNSII